MVRLNTQSAPFCIDNGLMVLSKVAFCLRSCLQDIFVHYWLMISSSNVGCHIGGIAVNIFAHADDIVLMAPSWHVLHDLLLLLDKCCKELVMLCNTKKLNV